MLGVPRWICDNRFLCYLHTGLCSQISGISWLTRELHIVLNSAAVRADNALALNLRMPLRDERKTKRSSSQSQDRPGSRRIHHETNFLFCQMWVVFPDGLTAADFCVVDSSASLCICRDIHFTKKCLFSSA